MTDEEFEEIFGSLKTFQCEMITVPWGSCRHGAANHMYGLKGENHPASSWLKNEAPEEYFEKRNQSVLESWMNADERRKQHSDKMKERWASGKLNAETSRKNGSHGLTGKDVHNTKSIEYKGKTYYGWRELKEATGVTKHLYNKYYINGIDPTARIGADGPAKGV